MDSSVERVWHDSPTRHAGCVAGCVPSGGLVWAPLSGAAAVSLVGASDLTLLVWTVKKSAVIMPKGWLVGI